MAKKFSVGIEIGGILKESFKSAVGKSKRDLKALQRLARIKIGASIEANKEKLKQQLSDWKSVVGTAISMGAPVVVGASFEYQMKRVKALAGATGEEFKKLEAKARELGATTQYSASEVGKAMEFLSMAGFKVGQTLKATEGVLNLATVGNVDLGTSADIASNILSGFGLKADEINRVVDVMAKTITSSNTSIVELGETMKYVAPVASKVGASIEEVSAMAGLLGNIGIKGSMAGTTLSSIFSRLSAPTGEAKRAISMLGVQIKDLKTGKMRNIVDILADLNKRLKSLPKYRQIEFIKQIFGEEAMKGAISLLDMAGTGELQKYVEEIKNAKGSAEKMVEEMNDTVLARWKSVLSAVESIFLTLYKPLEPIIKFTLDTVISGLRILNKVLEFTAPVLSPVIFGLGSLFVVSKLVAVGTTLAKLGVLNLTKAMLYAVFPSLRLVSSLNVVKAQSVLTSISLNRLSASLKGFWGSVKGFIGSVLTFSKNAFKSVIVGARTVGVALLTNPVFWVGAAIAGVGYLVISNWSKVKVFFSGFWSGIKEGFKPVFDIFKGFSGIFKPIIDGFKKVFGLFDGFKVKVEEIKSVGFVIGKALSFAFMPAVGVFKVVSWIVDKLSGVDFSFLESGLRAAFTPVFVVKSVVGWIIDKISNISFSGIFEEVQNVFGGVSNFIGGVFKAGFKLAFDGLKVLGGAVGSVFLAPIKLIEGVINKIKGFFKVLKDNPVGKVLSFGKNLVGGVFSKTSQVFKSVFERFKEKEIAKESSKEKEVVNESSKEVIKENFSKEKLEKVSKSGVSINNLIGSFNLTINANSKDVVKTIEDNKENIKEQILQMIREILDDEGRQLILSMGR